MIKEFINKPCLHHNLIEYLPPLLTCNFVSLFKCLLCKFGNVILC